MKIQIQPQALNLLENEGDGAITLLFGEVATGNQVEVGPFPPDVWAKFLEIANDPQAAKKLAEARSAAQARSRIVAPGGPLPPIAGLEGRRP